MRAEPRARTVRGEAAAVRPATWLDTAWAAAYPWRASACLLLLGVAAIRLWHLDARPLSPEEATIALEGWGVASAAEVDYSHGPGLPHLLAVLFAALTPTDVLTRVPSALAGIALAAAPLALPRLLGAGPALGATALLGFSPLLLLSSRSVSPSIVAYACLALVLLSVIRWLHSSDSRWLALAGGALALGLGSAPIFALWLLIGVLAALAAFGLQGARRLAEQLGPSDVKAAGLGFAGLLLGIGVLFLWAPSGFHAALVSPWLGWVPHVFGAGSRSGAFLGVAAVELLTFGAAAVALASARGLSAWQRFLALWLLLSLALAAVGRPFDPGLSIGWLLPGALLGASGLAWIAKRVNSPVLGPAALMATLACIPLVYALFTVLNALHTVQPVSLNRLGVAAAGLVFVALLAAQRKGLLVASALLLALLGAVLVSLSFNARLVAGPLEQMPLPGRWATADLRHAGNHVRTLARREAPSPVLVDASIRNLMGWELRDSRNIAYAGTETGIGEFAVIGAGRANELRAGTGEYSRLMVVREVRWTGGANLQGWFEWAVYGRAAVATSEHAIILIPWKEALRSG